MKEPILVVMAAGMGRRYGGLKQMDPVGNHGEWLIDYSLYDAHEAGFRQVVFIVREDILQDFKDTIGKRIAPYWKVSYAVQSVEDMPEGYGVPEGRTKPWGTGHAIYSGRDKIDGSPFMAINADDYYGPWAFDEIYKFLSTTEETPQKYQYAMVGYELENTVTEHGSVSRGICQVDSGGKLMEITERIRIENHLSGIQYTEDEGESWVLLPKETPVSLNCWGFHPSILQAMGESFPAFLEKALKENPEKAEYFLPSVVEELIQEGKASVTVLTSGDKWYGVTYQQDKEPVKEALRVMKEQGQYPENLWK